MVLEIIEKPLQLEPARLQWFLGSRYSSSVPHVNPEPLGDRALRFIGWLGGFYSNKAVRDELFLSPNNIPPY